MFRAATRCASIADLEGLTPAECVAEFASRTYPGSLDQTALDLAFLDTSEATPECRAAIRMLRAQEQNFFDITTRLELALSSVPAKQGLERTRNFWVLLKAARMSALVRCR